MAIGQKLTIKIHEDTAGNIVFDSAAVIDFTHTAGFVGATTVVKNDFTGTPNDAFIVQITTDSTALFSANLTIAQLTTMASDAVNAVFGNGEAGIPS